MNLKAYLPHSYRKISQMMPNALAMSCSDIIITKLKPQSQLQQTTNFVKSFLIFEKKCMIFQENLLPPDDSHEMLCLVIFEYAAKFEIVVCCKL